MKPKKVTDEESPTKLAKDYIRNKYDLMKTKPFIPIGPKFVITSSMVNQVKVELNK